ncbi:protein ALP1-like [Trichonephila clavipes]|nr:protein ALP1-like [Trichonephila clavipes]
MASDDQVIFALGFAAICDIEMSKAKKKKNLAEKVAATENTIRLLREFNEGISSRGRATYRNYKGFFSIVLLALVDANLKFLYVDVGTNRRVSDGGVWGKSKLRHAITNDDMNIREAATLPGSASKLPFVIVADDAFPLMPNIMKPYPGSNLSKECLVFNYRLSRARRVSQNAFGILAARFRVFGTTILTSVPNTKLIVLAACSLHNFLTNRSKNTYIPEDCADREDILNGVLIEGNWGQNTNQLISCQRISSRGIQLCKRCQGQIL